jgi:hypothetical protein
METETLKSFQSMGLKPSTNNRVFDGFRSASSLIAKEAPKNIPLPEASPNTSSIFNDSLDIHSIQYEGMDTSSTKLSTPSAPSPNTSKKFNFKRKCSPTRQQTLSEFYKGTGGADAALERDLDSSPDVQEIDDDGMDMDYSVNFGSRLAERPVKNEQIMFGGFTSAKNLLESSKVESASIKPEVKFEGFSSAKDLLVSSNVDETDSVDFKESDVEVIFEGFTSVKNLLKPAKLEGDSIKKEEITFGGFSSAKNLLKYKETNATTVQPKKRSRDKTTLSPRDDNNKAKRARDSSHGGGGTAKPKTSHHHTPEKGKVKQQLISERFQWRCQS